MSEKRNYQKELDIIIEGLVKEGRRPKLLLHACCAPCSSYCLEYLTKYFDITVYYH
ncbi:MAG: epoxyqueuosine reductase QueH, partial [Lachnospiraceae bacterium]|nr:epoxyqueuosine reductase QueH [Lachnospiraceae bacterium]